MSAQNFPSIVSRVFSNDQRDKIMKVFRRGVNASLLRLIVRLDLMEFKLSAFIARFFHYVVLSSKGSKGLPVRFLRIFSTTLNLTICREKSACQERTITNLYHLL